MQQTAHSVGGVVVYKGRASSSTIMMLFSHQARRDLFLYRHSFRPLFSSSALSFIRSFID